MKKLFALLLAALCSLLFMLCMTGCKKEGGAQGPEPQETPPAAAAVPTAEKELVSAGDGEFALTASGIYEAQIIFDGSANLMYTDIEGQKRGFLCSDPACSHNSEACSSFIPTPGAVFPPLVLTAGDRLLVFITDRLEQGGPILLSMDLDGTGREELLALPEHQHIGGGFFTDGTQLYFDTMEFKPDGSTYLQLCRLDLETKKFETVCPLSDPTGECMLAGALGGELLFCKAAGGRLEYYRADADAPGFGQPFFVDISPSGSSLLAEGWLFSLDEAAQTVTRTNLATNETATVKLTVQEGYTGLAMRYLFDGNLLAEATRPFTDGACDLCACFLNFDKGSCTEMTLRTPYNARPVYVMADAGSLVYVATDYRLYKPVGLAEGGDDTDYYYGSNVYAFMTKQDYEASNAAGYQMVEDAFAG